MQRSIQWSCSGFTILLGVAALAAPGDGKGAEGGPRPELTPAGIPVEAVTAFRKDLGWDGVTGDDDELAHLHAVACAAGYAPSCHPEAWRSADRVERRVRAAEVLRPRVDQGDALAMLVQGLPLLQRGTGRMLADAPDPSAGLAWLQRSCDVGLLAACTQTARALDKGVTGQERTDEAVHLLQRACDGGELRACAELGGHTLDGDGGLDKDDARAVALFQQACDGGEPVGCNYLAGAYDDGTGGLSADPIRAGALARQACEGGDQRACTGLGLWYVKGTHGLTKDLRHAMDLLERACTGGEPLGCRTLSKVMVLEGGTAEHPLDLNRMSALDMMACKGGDPDSCLQIAHHPIVLGLQGVDQDPATIDLIIRSVGRVSASDCDSGDRQACEDLGKASEFLRQACEDGHGEGCWLLAKNEDAGRGLARDRAGARRHAARACDLGFQPACGGL